MTDDFVIVRNPEEDSTLPYLVRLPVGPNGVVLKVRETWPRTAKVYCHPANTWPTEPEIVERVGVRSCARRGAAIDLVLDRGRENRSQFVFTRARGRDMIFWQSARTARQARPNVNVPKRRASGHVLEILVDSHERYPWRFSAQQATTERRALRTGDYAVEIDGAVVASVERKSLADLVGTLTGGKLRYLLAALAEVPRSALVIEDRYSAVFKLDRVRPAVVAEGLAEAQVRFPEVPIVFCETRPLAQEWTYRFLGAALDHHLSETPAALIADALAAAAAKPEPGVPASAHVRAWALQQGIAVATRGRLRSDVVAAYMAATDEQPER
ncbi:MAG: ERCC4 domain-containing protein [Acidimicrobiales bacterium]